MKFGFIGAGKVGFSLGKYLADNEMEVVGYYSEFKEDALEASKFTKSSVYKNIEDLVRDSDVLFLTVPDGAIEKVWNQVKKTVLVEKLCAIVVALYHQKSFRIYRNWEVSVILSIRSLQ